MDSDADVVVVFGGTNDFGHGDAKLGTFESRDPYTFYGAMHVLCEKLINRFPNADILFMTPLHRCSEDEVSKENGLPEETNLAGYVSIIREVAEFYGLPVLDLFLHKRFTAQGRYHQGNLYARRTASLRCRCTADRTAAHGIFADAVIKKMMQLRSLYVMIIRIE